MQIVWGLFCPMLSSQTSLDKAVACSSVVIHCPGLAWKWFCVSCWYHCRYPCMSFLLPCLISWCSPLPIKVGVLPSSGVSLHSLTSSVLNTLSGLLECCLWQYVVRVSHVTKQTFLLSIWHSPGPAAHLEHLSFSLSRLLTGPIPRDAIYWTYNVNGAFDGTPWELSNDSLLIPGGSKLTPLSTDTCDAQVTVLSPPGTFLLLSSHSLWLLGGT